jgi:mannan endo-1,4-beta-mannosidase
VILPEPFDDEYFRHMQWAHFASGAAGGGMRWPNRHPHVLTRGMREAQRGLAGFLPLIGWTHFRRRNLNDEVQVSAPALAPFACGDDAQAIAWLLRTDTVARRGDKRLKRDAVPVTGATLRIPGLAPARYLVTAWDTEAGQPRGTTEADATAEGLEIALPPIVTDVALAVRRA